MLANARASVQLPDPLPLSHSLTVEPIRWQAQWKGVLSATFCSAVSMTTVLLA